MNLLFILLSLITIPKDIYPSENQKAKIDSIYASFNMQADSTYATDKDKATYYLMADWAYYQSYTKLAKFFIQEALSEKINNEDLHMNCLGLATTISYRQGDLATALECAGKCLEFYTDEGDQLKISSTLFNIAAINFAFKKYDVAKGYIDESLNIVEGLDDIGDLSEKYGLASRIYNELSLYDAALEFSNKAILIDSVSQHSVQLAIKRVQKTEVLINIQRYKEAKKVLAKAIPVLRENNRLTFLATAMIQYGEIEYAEQKVDVAEKFLLRGVEIAEEVENNIVLERGYFDLYQLYKPTSIEKALEYHEKFYSIKARMYNIRATEFISSFNSIYDAAAKDKIIHNQQKRIWWHTFLIIFFTTISIILSIVFIFYKRKTNEIQKTNAKIVSMNLERENMIDLIKENKNISKPLKDKLLSIIQDVEMPDIQFTKREMDVAKLCSAGKINKEIADELGISVRTVESHKNNIFKKLGINNTVELVQYMNMTQNIE